MKPTRILMMVVAAVGVILGCELGSINGSTLEAQSQQPAESAVPGNAEKGRTLFNDAYGCGSCHGVRGTAGTPRIVPMSRTQAEFIRFIRKPTMATMPAFADATDQQLADVYAYLKSIPTSAIPPIESFPILNDVIKAIR